MAARRRNGGLLKADTKPAADVGSRFDVN